MVFFTWQLLSRSRGPDEFWRKRKIFKLAAHFIGRRRNCYSITIRNVHRSLVYSSTGRLLKKADLKELWENRVNSAAAQHGLKYNSLQEGLTRCNILLNRKVLADLGAWEPRTFKALADIACARTKLENVKDVANNPMPDNVLVKGLITE